MLLFKNVDFEFTDTHHRRKERYSVDPATFTSSFPPGGFSLAYAIDHFWPKPYHEPFRLPFDLNLPKGMGSVPKRSTTFRTYKLDQVNSANIFI